MSPSPIRQPGDIVNEIYSHNIQSIIQMCFDVGDDPTSLIEQVDRELQVIISILVFSFKKCFFKENGY